MKKSHYIAVAAATLFITSTAWAGALTVPNTFSAGTPAVAADVNANFTAAKTAVDDNNTRITANTTSAATNATNITTNTADIAANVTNITALQNARPGYATAVGSPAFNTITTLTGVGQPVVTLTLNAPASGFAIVTGRTYSLINHTLNALSVILLKVSATSGDIVEDHYTSVARVDPLSPTGTYGKQITASSVIPVVAGANIIYLNAYSPRGAAGDWISQTTMTAIYVPNAY